MITLKNIKVLDALVYADCYIEDAKEISFVICVDTNKKEIVKCSEVNMNTYVHMTVKRLCKLVEQKEPVPFELKYQWY